MDHNDSGIQPVAGVGKWPKDKDHSIHGPVKAACLSCRKKKAKCDGGKPSCLQCQRKQLECIYVRSRRGGARKKRNPAAPSALSEFLKKLDSLIGVPQFDLRHAEPQPGDDPVNVVRTFSDRDEIFRCYYNEVHPFLAVMPPRHYLVDVMPTLLPESPFLLAAQTVMTLAPHPMDPDPRSPRSKRLRSSASAALGRKTMEAVQRAMASGPDASIEAIQALTILAVWEWGSTNNASAAMDLFRQGVQVAISMGIHDMDANGTGFSLEGIDWRRDMRRRTWWILYVYQLTSGLVSGLQPPLGPDDPSIKVDFPVCSDKDRTWSTWINCIRQCFRVVNMINVLAMDGGPAEGGMKAWGSGDVPDNSPEQQELKRRQMVAIDRQIMELMKQTEEMSVVEQVPGGEEDVVSNQQIATRFGLAVIHIHQHRMTAFPEVSLFSKRICGLKGSSDDEESEDDDYVDTSTPQSVPPSATFSQTSSTQAQQPMLDNMPTMPGGWPFGGLDNSFGLGNSMMPGFDPNFANNDVYQVNQMMASLGTSGQQQPQQFSQQAYQAPVSQPHSNGNGTMTNSTGSAGDFNHQNGAANGAALNGHNAMSPVVGGGNMRSPSYTQSPQMPNANAPVAPVNPALANNWHYDLQNDSILSDMWQPETYPSYLPIPWFAQQGGAQSLYNTIDIDTDPTHFPGLEGSDNGGLPDLTQFNVRGSYQSNLTPAASTVPVPAQPAVAPAGVPQQPIPPPSVSESTVSMTSKKHKAWGVDENGDVAPTDDVKAAQALEAFPPGISLARCATAAHTIVRLEILHRSAALALDGSPKWIPFCSCGLIAGAYAFLLLVLAVQAENTFGTYSEARSEEVESLLTNVKIILGGLEAYGTMWEGIDMMAREVRAAVEAATQLPLEVQSQMSGRSSQSPGGEA
ncbi:hypothetical protein CspeluHIS016_0900290 [Cutaneotrichosporon spelunceum]|uniref:Zn(2)-C6 fungal-type domain-containing protein n=1 Tax=Cutaneotrichosporon spelunceum TaxID=1672016 RepID=A0AAD3YFB6_9TREE|nr:hypothetical protein CspeluHIS016_0900290 [Cutaneotrichosporon spelunceum]